MDRNTLKSWTWARNYALLAGVVITIIAALFMIFGKTLLPVEGIQWIGSVGLAITSLGIAAHSIVLFKKSEKKINVREKRNYVRRLIRFQKENSANINLVKSLINGKDHYLPQHILDKKMKQKGKEKYTYTKEEAEEIIKKGGVWIEKDDFSYYYALQFIDVSHYSADRKFIEQIEEWIKIGRELNTQKHFCQTWILARSTQLPNPDEAHGYYTRLDKAKEICEEMQELTNKELKRVR